ncbi:MAG: hypothetical protein ABIA92_05455 [Patescibacteria group bacterium]
MPEQLKLPSELTPEEKGKLLIKWGYDGADLADADEAVQSGGAKRLLVFDGFTIALDVVRKTEAVINHPFYGQVVMATKDGSLIDLNTGQPVDSANKFVRPSDGVLIDPNTELSAGGIGNAAIIGYLLANEDPDQEIAPGIRPEDVWALWADAGNDEAYRQWIERIHHLVNTQYVESHPSGVTGLSDVLLHPESKNDYAIVFQPGIGGTTQLTREHLKRLLLHGPANMNFSYIGLCPDGMDRNDGENFAWFAERGSEICPIISADTHAPTQLNQLQGAWPFLGMVNFNRFNASKILLDKKGEKSSGPQPDLDEALHRRIAEVIDLEQRKGRTILNTITDARGCLAILFHPDGTSECKYFESPFAEISGDNPVGLGDTHFAGERLETALALLDEWNSGSFSMGNAKRVIGFGQALSSMRIGSEEADPFEGIKIAGIRNVVESGERFDDIDSLKAALKAS